MRSTLPPPFVCLTLALVAAGAVVAGVIANNTAFWVAAASVFGLAGTATVVAICRDGGILKDVDAVRRRKP